MNKFIAGCMLGINPTKLNKTPVELMNESSPIYNAFSASKQCYQNAYLCAKELNANIVFGIAVVDFGGAKIPVEHAWLKSKDNICYDPTYQKNKTLKDATYYALTELDIKSYEKIATSFDNCDFKVIDILDLRRNKNFSELFERSNAARTKDLAHYLSEPNEESLSTTPPKC